MSDKIYKILWIDDEHEKMSAFIRSAKQSSIELIPHKSFKSGLDALENNYQLFDGVLLDAKILENESDVTGSEDTKFVHRAKERILALPKKFEIFVLTGQAKTYDSEDFKNAFPNIFRKGVSQDQDDLFKALKSAANRQIETQIRHDHPQIFAVLNKYGADATKTILKILCGVKRGALDFDDNLYFTPLRIILELMFRKANEIGLLHDVLVQKCDNQVNLTEASLFMAGEKTKHCNVYCKKAHFPKVIATNVRNFLFITGAASHTSNVDVTKNIDVQDYRNTVNTPYLLYSLTFQLMDVLLWFDDYSRKNNNYADNVALWSNIVEVNPISDEFSSGEVINMHPKGFAFFKPDDGSPNAFIPPALVSKFSLQDDQPIKVKCVLKDKGPEVIEIIIETN